MLESLTMSNFVDTERSLNKSEHTSATILVVDDIADNRDLLIRRLSRRGYRCIEAKDGIEALACLKKNLIHLVLLDVTMPGMSGIEVLKHIRKHFFQNQLPVIMVTADAQKENVEFAKSLGANDYITKPVDFVAAIACVQKNLDLSRASTQISNARRDLQLARLGQ